jgi:hypothetical protein
VSVCVHVFVQLNDVSTSLRDSMKHYADVIPLHIYHLPIFYSCNNNNVRGKENDYGGNKNSVTNVESRAPNMATTVNGVQERNMCHMLYLNLYNSE